MVLSDYDGPLGLNLALHWQKKKKRQKLSTTGKATPEPVWAHRLVIVTSILPIILITELFSGVWSITSGAFTVMLSSTEGGFPIPCLFAFLFLCLSWEII